MMERIAETSPRLKTRITGVLYLLAMLTGIFAQGFVSERLVVDGNAAATAANILTHKGLFQLGYAVYLIEMACNIAMTALFYDLLKPAGRSVSLLAAFFGFYALLTGYLIVRSTFLPRILGVLGMFGGLGWLSFLYLPLGHFLFLYVVALALLGAGALIVWLLVFGVNEQRWKEQASAAGNYS